MKKTAKSKKDGVVYTPYWLAKLMITESVARQPIDEQRKLIDPSCGDGAFLIPALEVAVEWAREKQLNGGDLTLFLQNFINGFDIDQVAVDRCREKLDSVLMRHEIPRINWNIHCCDSLLDATGPRSLTGQFDYVLGNPPYIRIQDLDQETRSRLQNEWLFCREGSTDIFLAFFELGIRLLNDRAILAYITSRSYFDSAAARLLRSEVLKLGLLDQIIDFGEEQVFPEVSTYTAVTFLSRPHPTRNEVTIKKIKPVSKIEVWSDQLPTSQFTQKRWNIVKNDDAAFIKNIENRGPKLGDMCQIHVGLATLRDGVYVNKILDNCALQDGETITILASDGAQHEIESDACRPIVKVSTLKNDNEDQRMAIIFPYTEQNGVCLPWDEKTTRDFPLAMNFLEQNRPSLQNRKHKTRTWFEYGSTQGLTTLFGEKILVPSMTSNGQTFLWEKKSFTFYSGYGIFFDGNLRLLFDQLSSDEFKRYAKLSGRALRGGWFSMTKASLSNFSLSPETWDLLKSFDSSTEPQQTTH